MKLTYVLRNPEIAKRMVAQIKMLAGPANAAGRPLQVTISEYKQQRTGEQNRLFHALLNDIAEQATVNGRYFDADTWKELIRRRFIGTDEINLPDGTRIERGISTTTLSVAEFNQLIEKVTAWAVTDLGVEFQQEPACSR